MTIKDFFNPLTIGSSNTATKNSLTKQIRQETTNQQGDTNSFTQNLQQALGSAQNCEASIASDESTDGTSSSEYSFTGSLINIGLGLATGNVLSSGINSAAMLQGLMNQDISKQFTELGLNISSSFLAGLAGLDSATEVASTAPPLNSVKDTVSSHLSELSKDSVTKTEESVTKAKDKLNIDRTIHWPIQNILPEELLKNDKKES